MKQYLFVHLLGSWLVLCLFGPLSSLAQDGSASQEAAKSQYGLKAGINFAELWGDDAIPESDRKVGYSFGAYASFKLSTAWKVQPELIWSLQGEKSETKGRYDISYLNIPIMFKWTEGRFYTELGPQLGLLTINTRECFQNNSTFLLGLLHESSVRKTSYSPL